MHVLNRKITAVSQNKRKFILCIYYIFLLKRNSFFVRLGDLNLGDQRVGEYNVDVEKVTFYPDYKLQQNHHDLALVRLAQNVKFEVILG